jgi:hypothetical protein
MLVFSFSKNGKARSWMGARAQGPIIGDATVIKDMIKILIHLQVTVIAL